MRRIIHRLPFLAICCVVLFLGCSKWKDVRLPESGATLEGTVTYKGEKVTVALVIAQGDNPTTAEAFIDENGRYKLTNVPLGEVNLAVVSEAGKGQLRGEMMARAAGKATGPPRKVIDIPPKYANPTTSGITTTINKGENTYNIVITK